MKNYSVYLAYLQKPVVLTVIAVAAVILIGGGFLIYSNSKASKNVPGQTNPKLVQEEVKKLVAEVGKLIDLPAGEDPTIATVTDISKLKDQPFFRNAKNGDKVLIYSKAKKAILYDPNNHKVIDIAPINVGTSSAQTTPESSASAKPKPKSTP